MLPDIIPWEGSMEGNIEGNIEGSRGQGFLFFMNSKCSLEACREEKTGRIYVRRVISREQIPVYTLLAGQRLPHIPRVYSIQEAEDRAYVYEEYLSGMALSRILDERETLDARSTAAIGIQLLEALEAVHHLSIIHRDIKPENIMLGENGTVYLTDFDIARRGDQPGLSGEDRDTQLLGTSGFAAPEQYGFRRTDRRADLYSLGVLLNICLTGRYPQDQLADRPLGPVIQKASELDRENRYQNAEEMLHALRMVEKEWEMGFSLSALPGRAFAFFRKIPGFRSGNFFLSLLALCAYTFVAAFFAYGYRIEASTPRGFYTVTATLLICLSWYVFLFDLFHVRTRLGLLKIGKHPAVFFLKCGLALALWTFMLLILGALIMLFLESLGVL